MRLHKIQIIGRLGRDPELRYLQSGDPVCTFSVAVDESYTGKAGKVDQTSWWRVTQFGPAAENHNKYLVKGQEVYVEGRLEFDPATGSPKIWQRSDGTPGVSFEIRASTVQYGVKSGGGGGGGSVAGPVATAAGDPYAIDDEAEEDIPF
jgi:single-strand DNA-binding protein